MTKPTKHLQEKWSNDVILHKLHNFAFRANGGGGPLGLSIKAMKLNVSK